MCWRELSCDNRLTTLSGDAPAIRRSNAWFAAAIFSVTGIPNHGKSQWLVSQLISKCKRFGITHDVTVFMVAHPTKMQSTDADKDPLPGLYDLSGSAHWRNKCDAGLVVYRDFDEAETLVLSRKIRKQPICGVQGAVTFFFNPVTRRYEDREGSFRARGKKKSQAAAVLDR